MGRRRIGRPVYQKPYPEWVDRLRQYPRGFKVPEFTLFSGENNQSTVEHIGRFTVQCGEASADGNLKLRLFPNSLTGTLLGLAWYISQSTGEFSADFG